MSLMAMTINLLIAVRFRLLLVFSWRDSSKMFVWHVFIIIFPICLSMAAFMFVDIVTLTHNMREVDIPDILMCGPTRLPHRNVN